MFWKEKIEYDKWLYLECLKVYPVFLQLVETLGDWENVSIRQAKELAKLAGIEDTEDWLRENKKIKIRVTKNHKWKRTLSIYSMIWKHNLYICIEKNKTETIESIKKWIEDYQKKYDFLIDNEEIIIENIEREKLCIERMRSFDYEIKKYFQKLDRFI